VVLQNCECKGTSFFLNHQILGILFC